MKNDLSKADSLFSKKIISWYEINGRNTLPWRKNITPYRVWISEIMLQQTQV
ncbi:A/G-specific adenine glycosylase, partial [Gammaproteobacteria bacterium]|nr:A/G-specific adenine glycosylase [Gammaproteobacteria bacterium]